MQSGHNQTDLGLEGREGLERKGERREPGGAARRAKVPNEWVIKMPTLYNEEQPSP